MEPVQIKFFTQKPFPRLDYITSLILGDILRLNYDIITEKDNLTGSPLINYSDENIEGALRIKPQGLLSEEGLSEKEISVSDWNNLPVFFQTDINSDLPFDIFAASFWLVTRYEEYLPFTPDEHGRFRASSSLAGKNGFLHKPVIDLWAKELRRLLQGKFPQLTFRNNDFRSLLTIDVDVPFAYKGRTLIRTLGGLGRDLVSDHKKVSERLRVISGRKNDPFDVFDFITGKAVSAGTETMFFISAGDHSGYDKNPSWKNDDYRKLIRNLSSEFKTGIHPSYFAAENYSILESETDRLKIITEKKVTASRFHYLRFRFPDSYRNLIEAGITEDYSMCFHDEPGFRAGIARPFMFYDLVAEKLTGLRIIPFQVMDVTLFQYRMLDPEAASDALSKIISETRSVGGLFVSLWHNTSLPETSEGRRWRSVFESMLQLQQK